MTSPEAQRNREAFPIVSAIVDEVRSVFGQGAKLCYASEGGKEIGRRITGGVPAAVWKKVPTTTKRR